MVFLEASVGRLHTITAFGTACTWCVQSPCRHFLSSHWVLKLSGDPPLGAALHGGEPSQAWRHTQWEGFTGRSRSEAGPPVGKRTVARGRAVGELWGGHSRCRSWLGQRAQPGWLQVATPTPSGCRKMTGPAGAAGPWGRGSAPLPNVALNRSLQLPEPPFPPLN